MVAWPGTLPQSPLLNGYKETFPQGIVRSEVDVGPAKQRKRYTSGVRPITANFRFDSTQLATFEAFYFTTLGNGALQFDFDNPVTGVQESFRFTDKVPTVVQSGLEFVVSAQLEQMP